MNALAAAMSVASPAGDRARLSVLIFHRVLRSFDPMLPDEPDAPRFDQILGWMRSWFNVLPLDEAVMRLANGTLPGRSASITFDDGYADNHDVALPILQRHGVRATFFVATDYVDGGCMWNDRIIAAVQRCSRSTLDLDALGLGTHAIGSAEERIAAIATIIGNVKYRPVAEREAISDRILELAKVDRPRNLMLSTDQIRALATAGMQIGAHTASHPILARLNPTESRREIHASKATLEETLQRPVRLFAYPNGKPGIDYRAEDVTAARELGFVGAVSTSPGTAVSSTDIMQIPRFTPWDRPKIAFGLRLLANCFRKPTFA